MTLDQDILWDPSHDTPLDGYRAFRERWLRLAANIHQSGTPTLLVGSGIPDQYELVSGRQFFSGVRYATLVCSEEAIAERLEGRPAWRGSGEPTFIAQMIDYNALAQRERSDNDACDDRVRHHGSGAAGLG